MRVLMFIAFAVTAIETATCQIPSVECVKYDLETTGKNARVFGEAFYELNGKRFLYRVELTEIDDEPPAKLTCGFDGNEYWFAAYRSRQGEQSAAIVARYRSEKSLSEELPRRVYCYRSGRAYLDRVAVLEFVKTVCFSENGNKSRDEMERNIIAHDKAALISKRSQSKLGGSDFFNFENLNFEIHSAGDEHPTRNFLVQVDNDEDFPIVKIRAKVPGGYYSGFSLPWHPLPPSFDMTRVGKAELDPIEFLPQFYSNSDTELLTYGD